MDNRTSECDWVIDQIAYGNSLKEAKPKYTPWFIINKNNNLPTYDFSKNVSKIIWSHKCEDQCYHCGYGDVHMYIIRMNDNNYCLLKEWDGCMTYSATLDYDDCGVYIAHTFYDLFWMSMIDSDRILYNESILPFQLRQKALIAFFNRSDVIALRVFANQLDLVGYIYKDLTLEKVNKKK